ncbi:hypothetical protein F2Q68_00043194 [Brassica cretica]|uniref:Uncharacterized protein n=1 Tax=Brassica cretica TaxID=69181 RepID=A0A8S9LNU7_BRACR|nr:hypothetical protein F2Q68_00043194 [Brassica cretica]
MVSSRIVDLPEDDVTDAVLPIPEMMFTYQSSRAINHILNSLEDEEIQILRMSPFGKIVDITEKPGFSGRFTRFSLREFAIVTGLNRPNTTHTAQR